MAWIYYCPRWIACSRPTCAWPCWEKSRPSGSPRWNSRNANTPSPRVACPITTRPRCDSHSPARRRSSAPPHRSRRERAPARAALRRSPDFDGLLLTANTCSGFPRGDGCAFRFYDASVDALADAVRRALFHAQGRRGVECGSRARDGDGCLVVRDRRCDRGALRIPSRAARFATGA